MSVNTYYYLMKFNEIVSIQIRMWHEARRQEKAVRHKMVDNAKRHERRKQFYETVRRDPQEFMQLHGQKMPIHVDPAIAEAAESPNILRKWQGDPKISIDRFDVRVHLEQIQEAPNKEAKKKPKDDDVVELQCEYERYRILVFNEYKKVTESSFLAQIAKKEFWPIQSSSSSSTYKKEHEKKKKLADKRAAIAFTYGDSETIRGSGSWTRREQPQNDVSDSDDDLDEPEEIDPVIDPNELTAEQAAALNKIGTQFCITSGVFLQLLNLDRKEQTSTAQIKEIDKAKQALSGRHAKADRAILKRRRALIIGNLGASAQNSEEATTTLLSFLASTNKANLKEESSSSESGEEFVKTEFITSFGGEEERNGGKRGDQEEDEGTGIVQGPILPTKEYRRLLELSRRKSESPESQWTDQREQHVHSRRRRTRSRSPRRHHTHGHRRSRSRSRRRNSSHRRRYSRDRRRRTASSSRSRSPSPKQPSHHSSSRHEQNQRRQSVSSKEKHSNGREERQKPKEAHSREAILTEEVTKGRQSSSDDTLSDSPLNVRSSMSESEKERIERENRKRRIRRTKRMVREQQRSKLPDESGSQAEESKAEKAARKLRLQMQKTLTKTAAQLKEEEEQRQREMIREKRQREEELLEESRQLRQREREKRRAEEERERKEREKSGKRRCRRRHSSSSSSSR